MTVDLDWVWVNAGVKQRLEALRWARSSLMEASGVARLRRRSRRRLSVLGGRRATSDAVLLPDM